MFALSQTHTIILALQEKGIVEASELGRDEAQNPRSHKARCEGERQWRLEAPEKELEQTREDARRELLLQQADEKSMVPQ